MSILAVLASVVVTVSPPLAAPKLVVPDPPTASSRDSYTTNEIRYPRLDAPLSAVALSSGVGAHFVTHWRNKPSRDQNWLEVENVSGANARAQVRGNDGN